MYKLSCSEPSVSQNKLDNKKKTIKTIQNQQPGEGIRKPIRELQKELDDIKKAETARRNSHLDEQSCQVAGRGKDQDGNCYN